MKKINKQINRDKAFLTRLHVSTAKTQISPHIRLWLCVCVWGGGGGGGRTFGTSKMDLIPQGRFDNSEAGTLVLFVLCRALWLLNAKPFTRWKQEVKRMSLNGLTYRETHQVKKVKELQ